MDEVIVGVSGLTVILTTTNCSHQLSVSSVVVYTFLGVMTAPLSVKSQFVGDLNVNLSQTEGRESDKDLTEIMVVEEI